MLGVFAKVVRGQPVKTRLQGLLARQEAERFHVASVADTLETAVQVIPAPFLFLQGGEEEAAVEDLRARLFRTGFDPKLWNALQLRAQSGRDLGERLAHAFMAMCGEVAPQHPALIVGSDSPSLTPANLRVGLELLSRRGSCVEGKLPASVREEGAARGNDPHSAVDVRPRGATAPFRPASHLSGSDWEAPGPQMSVGSGVSSVPVTPEHGGSVAPPDLVLGPTTDGGYWAIGLRRPYPGLLNGIAWSTERTLADTLARARRRALRVQLLPCWTDVDHPEDLHELARQIRALRERGDTHTARHSELFLRELDIQRFGRRRRT